VLVACAQYAVRDGDSEANLERSVTAILDAIEGGADLIILPELANSGCEFSSREHALGLAEELGNPGSPTLWAWKELAEKSGVFVVGGLLEREGNALCNSAVVVGPDNFLGRYCNIPARILQDHEESANLEVQHGIARMYAELRITPKQRRRVREMRNPLRTHALRRNGVRRTRRRKSRAPDPRFSRKLAGFTACAWRDSNLWYGA
jgi:Carbon-nitrogen hydrolase